MKKAAQLYSFQRGRLNRIHRISGECDDERAKFFEVGARKESLHMSVLSQQWFSSASAHGRHHLQEDPVHVLVEGLVRIVFRQVESDLLERLVNLVESIEDFSGRRLEEILLVAMGVRGFGHLSRKVSGACSASGFLLRTEAEETRGRQERRNEKRGDEQSRSQTTSDVEWETKNGSISPCGP